MHRLEEGFYLQKSLSFQISIDTKCNRTDCSMSAVVPGEDYFLKIWNEQNENGCNY